MSKTRGISLIGGALAMGFWGQAVLAQTKPQPAAPDTGANSGLQDIVVTAQRREERLQGVPISITALGAQALQNAGAQDIGNLNVAVPGLTLIKGTTGITQHYLRGIGSAGTTIGEEPSVATYVDGFYIPTPNAAMFSFADAARVEVLKGPQGTLFGRNASGGVIQIITRDPTFTPHYEAALSYGNYDTVTGSVYATTGITDTLAVSVTGRVNDQGKGYGRNLTTGSEANKTQERSVRGKLLFDSGPLRQVIETDYISYETDHGIARNALPDWKLAINIPFSGSVYDTQANIEPGQRSSQWAVRSTTTIDLGGVTVKNLAQVWRYKQQLDVDFDNGPIDLLRGDSRRRDRIFTNEAQIASAGDGPLSWIGGIFYMNYKSAWLPFAQTGSAIGGRISAVRPIIHTRSVATFAQATLEVLPGTNVTAGFRYTWEKKDFDFSQTLNGALVTEASARLKESTPTWRFAIDHKIAPDAMIYATYNRGFKSGGFSVVSSPAGQTPVDPELVDAFELGIKSELFGGLLRANLAGFYTDFRGLQLQQQVQGPGGSFITLLTNAASTEIKGVEIELEAQPVRGLNLTLGAGYIDGTYSKFPGTPFTTRNPNGTNTTTTGDASGNRLPRTAKFTMNAGIQYQIETAAGEIIPRASYYHNGGFAFEPDQRLRQGSYDLINASVDFKPSGRSWTFGAYVENLTKEIYYIGMTSTALGDGGAVGAPRTYGVRARIEM